MCLSLFDAHRRRLATHKSPTNRAELGRSCTQRGRFGVGSRFAKGFQLALRFSSTYYGLGGCA
jgi:hypothetical protein